MKKTLLKTHKKAAAIFAVMLCVMLVCALLPLGITVAYADSDPHYPAFSGDPYSNQLVRYELNDECSGYYMTPKAEGKYRTFIFIHGGGGVNGEKNRLWSPINKWVKEGYFPPMVVVIPEVVGSYAGESRLDIDDFQMYIYKGYTKRFNTLLNNVLDGSLTSQIDTEKPLYIAGFSMGGLAAVYAGDEYHEKVNNVGGLSPSSSFYLGDGNWGFRNYATDIHFSTDDDALVYLSCGLGEGDFKDTIDRYEAGIKVNAGNNLVLNYKAPASWGRHGWELEQKEIFMYLYYNIYGELPSEELVESATANISTRTPSVVQTEETHTGTYEEPEGPVKPPKQLVPEDVKGYSFGSATFTYDGEKHMINVAPLSNATEGVNISYTYNGAEFTGATEPGSYPITATLTKEGYNDLVLTATLKIKQPGANNMLIDLDMSTYIKDATATDPNNVSGSIGSIINDGTLASSTIVKMSSQSGRWTNLDLSKESFQNDASSTTSYLRRTINTPICADENRHSIVIEKALEEQANTISFWANYTPVNRESVEYNLLDYNVKYTGSDDGKHLLTLDQAPTTTGQFKLVGRGQETIYGDITDKAAGKWAQYVITNPVYEEGQKTMKIYVNGECVGEKTVTKPTGTLETVKLCFGGEAKPTLAGYYWPTDISLGEILVYSGVLSDDDISAEYNGSKARYMEAGEGSLETITGYTFEDNTLEYDGESHTIEVTAAADATEGVSVSYTVNGAAFSGAVNVGTYEVKALLKKDGYKDLTLTAKLTIEPAGVQPVDDGEILVDLDLTNFVPSKVSGSSGIVNKGKSTTATIEAYSSGEVALTTDYLYNKDDFSTNKKVIRLTHNDLATQTSAKRLKKYFELSDPAFEEQDVTLSFWTNLDPISKQTNSSAFTAIVQYNAKRDNGSYKDDTTSSRARLWQYTLDTSGSYLWGSAWNSEIAMNNSRQWHHVVMTIPKFAGGAKTVNVYVDGALGITQNVNLGGHALASSFIGFGSDENKAYVSTDISFADIKVYAGAMSEEGIENLYNSEKDFYDNMLYNKITVSKDGSTITKLSDLEAGDTITISCNENTSDGLRVFAACYNAEGSMLSATTAVTNGEGETALTIPEGFDNVKIYSWNITKLSPLQKVAILVK